MEEGKPMKVVYVSGPYTKPDPCVNVNEHIRAADRLGELGYAPLVPVLSHFWHTMSPHPYEFWIGIDLEFVRRCDAVLRLPGESSGADRETALAERLRIPVFRSIEELDAEMGRREADRRDRDSREAAE
jgi:hypothetical protein